MIKRKLYNRLLILGVVGSITISSGVVAFAHNAKGTNSPKSKIEGKLDVQRKGGDFKENIKNKGMQRSNFLENLLTTQVTAGVITQVESDKVTAFLKTKEEARKAEMDAQKAKLEAMTDTEKKVAMEAKKAARVAEKARLKAMTTEEKAAYLKANRPNNASIFTELVTAGILIKDQADKIKAAAVQKHEEGRELNIQ